MPVALDAALSGMLQQQRNIELIANNIANINTTGYKRVRVHFQDLLDSAEVLAYVRGELPAGATPATSSGVGSASVERVFAQGPIQQSDSPLDLAIIGDGFFAVQLENAIALLEPAGAGNVRSVAGVPASSASGTYAIVTAATGAVTVTFTPDDGGPPTVANATVAAGEANNTLIPGATLTFASALTDGEDTVRITSRAYTRSGLLHIDADRQLVLANGMRLSPSVTLPESFLAITIRQDGAVMVLRSLSEAELAALDPEDPTLTTEEVAGQIEITRFEQPRGLVSVGESLYVQSVAVGAVIDGVPSEDGLGRIASGFLEASNVDVSEEMTALIVASRAYQMNLAAYRSIEEMLTQAGELV